mgnify:FL=1
MGKRRNLTLEDYISESTVNIRSDRALASKLLIDVIQDMAKSAADRREFGAIAAKYVENLQRSNEQMVKLATILQKQKQEQFGLTEDDKDQLFDLLKEDKLDGVS